MTMMMRDKNEYIIYRLRGSVLCTYIRFLVYDKQAVRFYLNYGHV